MIRVDDAATLLSRVVRADDKMLGRLMWLEHPVEGEAPISADLLRWCRSFLLEFAQALTDGNGGWLQEVRIATKPTDPPIRFVKGMDASPSDTTPAEVAAAEPAKTTVLDPRDVAAALGPLEAFADQTAPIDPHVIAEAEQGGGVAATEFMAPFDPKDFPGPLPFAGGADPPLPTSPEPHPASGSTTTVDPDAVAAGETAAFSPVPQAPSFAVEKYAVVVLLTESVSVEVRQSIHERYGIGGEPARAQLDQAFGRAMRHDPTLRKQFDEAMRRWRKRGGGR